MFDLFRLEQPACEEATDDGADSAKRPLLFCGENLEETTTMGVKKDEEKPISTHHSGQLRRTHTHAHLT